MPAAPMDQDKQPTHLQKPLPPSFKAPTPPCLGDDDETELESDMDEDDASVFLSRSKAAKAEATQDRAPTRNMKLQARHKRINAQKAAAKQKRDASAHSEGEEMGEGEAEPKLSLLMDLLREPQKLIQKETTTQKQLPRKCLAERPMRSSPGWQPQRQMQPEADQIETGQMRDTDEG